MINQWIADILSTSSASILVFVLILCALGALNFVWRNRISAQKKQIKHELEDAKKNANQVKSLFIANISHEIRTPLNAILGHAQLLTREVDLDPKRLDSINSILGSSEHLSDLINDLLDIASIESNSMVVTKKDFDLSDMLKGLSKLFEKRCSQKGLEWHTTGDIEHAQNVHGDMGKIRQVLVKLISNAIKFTDSGEVALTLEHKQNQYKFAIEDTGIGISLRQQQNIYNAFSRQKQYQPGVGLGLVIAKNQIELMGGSLQLDSTPGNGSRFSFTLILPKAKGPVHIRTIRGRRVTRLAHSTASPDRIVRILIIDRNEQTKQVLMQMLADVGITVTQARDGEEALRLLSNVDTNQLPQLVFYDIDVPLVTDSCQLKKMREAYHDSSMQFVVLSAAGIQTQIKKHLIIDSDDDFKNFIAKPYRFEAIYETVHKLLGVKFEYREQQHLNNNESSMISASMLPESIYFDMKDAANDYEIAKLEQSLKSLQQHSPDNEALIQHLTSYLSYYDMEGLLAELEKVYRQ